ncbi:MAG TPA: nuclear transport factor 2 family protein [Ramlibacter sp.]|nr:nuclear transport factor 2 family protein [Ramlibacter sp.]
MNAIAPLLIRLEEERCHALLTGDAERLKALMHPGLFHVHASANVEDFEAYTGTATLKSLYSQLRRFDDLKVQVLGDTALMTGRQLAVSSRRASGEQVYIDSMVTQVWVRNGEHWQQLSYQTTPREMKITPAADRR